MAGMKTKPKAIPQIPPIVTKRIVTDRTNADATSPTQPSTEPDIITNRYPKRLLRADAIGAKKKLF